MNPEQENGLRVGITGGIGSGKSTVCRIFGFFGVPVYDADYWAKWLLNNNEGIKMAVRKVFGPEAYMPEYNRAFIAKSVFNDPEKLAALNAIAHPAVEKHSLAWHREQISNGSPYTVKEAALIIESGAYKYLDFLILVSAPEKLRIQRVMDRDGVNMEQVLGRIRNQLPESEKMNFADAVIVNDGQHSLIKQVWKLHQTLLKRSLK